ncbi:MAG TPA: flagellar hook-associated protein FlgK [Acidimicrobiales bacterium]|nr:flagellar hook-associated protein FlgK [Acidimicrobiales bacterium]
MSFQALSTGYTGLYSSQIGIDTASNNVSNVNTPGYTRQRVELRPRLSRQLLAGRVGTGVDAFDITRSRDAFLDARVRGAQGSLGALETNADLLERAEKILGEPDFGIGASLNDLWDAFENLSLSPTDKGSRVAVISQLESLSGRINSISKGVDQLQDDTSLKFSVAVDEANSMLQELADLNNAIQRAGTKNGMPNDLLDRRDQLLDKAAQKLGAHIQINGDNSARLTLNGLALVDGAQALSLTYDATTGTLTHSTGFDVQAGGEIGGLQTFLSSDLTAIRTDLNQLVVDLADNVNARNQAGFTAPGVAGGDLLSYSPLNPSGTIAVGVTDPAEIAASSDGGTPFPAHNGENARSLADLRFDTVAAGGTLTLHGAARSFTSAIGAKAAIARQTADAQADLTTSAELSRSASQGVNVDEEMIDLIRYQRAYQASARVITAADQMLDTLINRTGLVGR